MTSSLISRELDSLNLDGISLLLSNLGKQLGQAQAMSRAEAVSLDRERQSLKNRYTSLLVDLDGRFTRLKELLVPGDREKPSSEALGRSVDYSWSSPGEHLLRRAGRLSAAIQRGSEGQGDLGELKNSYRKLVRRYNALVKTGNLAKRSDRDRVRSKLVEIAHQFRRVEKTLNNRDP
jgi:hypothetical protein